MGIFDDLSKAIGQSGDKAFLAVLIQAFGLTILLLVGVSAGLLWTLGLFMPQSVVLPWFGEVGLTLALTLASLPLLLVMSIVLMFPVAAVFIGLFTDRIADAVEVRHYPHRLDQRRIPIHESLWAGIRLALLMLLVNGAALLVYVIAAPLAPVTFWLVNGFLLGREYAQQVAIRHIPVKDARNFRRANRGQIWMLGAVLAVPLSIPLINLLIPIIGVAAYTHLFHRLDRARTR